MLVTPAASHISSQSHQRSITITSTLILNILLSCIFHLSPDRFIKHQDDKVPGLSEAGKTKRRHRNLVTMKFNLLSFVLEAASVILVAISRTFFIRLLYLLVNYCGTPLVQTTLVQTTSRIEQYLVCRCTTWVLRTTGGRLGNTSRSNLGSAGDQEESHQHQHPHHLELLTFVLFLSK